jgi:hypothetical protein
VAEFQLHQARALLAEAKRLGLQCPPIAAILSNPEALRLSVFALCAPPGVDIPAELRVPPSVQRRRRHGWPDHLGTIGAIPYQQWLPPCTNWFGDPRPRLWGEACRDIRPGWSS